MLVSNPTPSPDASPLRVDPQKARELMIAVKERYERDKGEGRKWDGEEVRDLLRTLTTVYPGDEGFEGVWRVVGEEEMEGWDMEVLGGVIFSAWRSGVKAPSTEKIVQRVGARALQCDRECSGNTAARVLFCVGRMSGGEEFKDRVFERYVDNMLGRGMGSREISMGMRALARWKDGAEFLGIFDSLAKRMARDDALRRATVGEVTGALWACGKVY
ncbi:hypothetical protein TrRE_jg477, partial [Triparma retinervis]